jgi:hypothetical protein
MIAAIGEVLAGKTYLCEEVGHFRPAVSSGPGIQVPAPDGPQAHRPKAQHHARP